MNGVSMAYSKLVLIAVCVLTTSVYSQDGITVLQNEYYPAAQPTSYPFLVGRQLSPATEIMHSSPPAMINSSCCVPIVPTLGQGIRDTINALLPCRGIRRRAYPGLLFSERFYETSCCGSNVTTHSEAHIDTGQAPTPAQPSQEPELVVPETIDSAIRFQPLPSLPSVNSGNEIRPVSGSNVINATTTSPTTQSILRIPDNPLRR